MNRKLPFFMTALFCLAVTSAFCDETNLLARWGVPTNELVAAADPITQSVSSEDLAESLGIKHWDFLVQVPDKWAYVTIGFHWIGESGTNDLGYFSFPVDRINPDTGKEIPGPYQDKILLVISPVDTSTENPWKNSAKLRIFGKDYEKGVSGFVFVENPFRKEKEGYTTYSAPMAVHDHKIKPGSIEQALGTEFDLTKSAKSAFRVSFEEGLHTTFK